MDVGQKAANLVCMQQRQQAALVRRSSSYQRHQSINSLWL
jgi:hypothetical protein